jgi:hypothetical protein
MEVAIIVAIAIIAIGVVLYPLLSHRDKQPFAPLSQKALDEQVARYREAISRGTLCDRCLAANAPGSRFCAECGRSLS